LQLLQFAAPLATRASAALPFNFRDYLELLDWTGRKLPTLGTVVLDSPAPHALQHLSIDPVTWLLAMKSENNGPTRPLERLRRHVERSARPAPTSNDIRGAESAPTLPSPP
jgi:hypothetical protein